MVSKKKKCYNKKMDYSYHIIKNFPKNYPLRMKFLANFIYFFGKTIIHRRKNLLNKKDIKATKKLLKPGDIILTGGFKRLNHLFIGGKFTHSLICFSKGTVIHSIADGVELDPLNRILCEYDTLAILRPKTSSKHKVQKMLSYAKTQLGKPYDYEFKNDKEKIYCSELIINALKSAKINSGLKRSTKIFRPQSFLKGNFELVFKSHNIDIDDLPK